LIERAGGTPVRFPTIEIAPPRDIRPLENLIARLDEFDIAIFVSPSAVARAMEAIRAHRRGELSPRTTVACVGSGSAKALAEFGIADVLAPTRTDSEGLLELTPLQQVAGKRIVIFRGEDGRELLGETLAARGARVEYAACYRRLRPRADAAALALAFAQGEIDVVTATSAEALRNLWDMLGDAGAPPIQIPIMVVSERLRQISRELGIKGPVQVAPTASDEAIVAAIQAWREAQKSL
jgi:uroporphyrinogen-III synthase